MGAKEWRSKRPKEIKIGWRTITISWETNIIADDGSECYGQYDHANKTIKIDDTLTGTLLLATIIHEVVHAIEYEYHIPIPHYVVHWLDNVLAQTLGPFMFDE